MDIRKADQHFIHTYNRSTTFVRGEGMYLIDDEGKKYLDMGAGIAVSALGYSNEEYKQGLKDQVDKLIHISNLYFNEPAVKAANYLCEASGMDRVFFTNSGAEAIEGALKLARKYARTKNPDNGGEIIAMEHSFHGRTMGALSVTGTKHYREPFEPLIGGVSFAEYNNLDSVKALITSDTCAIIMESLQGEGGIHPASEDFMKGVRALCDEKGILLILDEIQSGYGRTGRFFAHQWAGIRPDLITTAKGMGNGFPIGGVLIAPQFKARKGMLGTTFGGNHLACAAAIAVADTIAAEGLVENARRVGDRLLERLRTLPALHDVRGRGLMIGFDVEGSASELRRRLVFEQHVFTGGAGAHTVRLLPALGLSEAQADEFVARLKALLEDFH